MGQEDTLAHDDRRKGATLRRKWACLLLAPTLLAMAAVGCEPFETELTIYADGSGRMVQTARLSPAAQVMLKMYAGPRMKGYRPILTEEDAAGWSRNNAWSGITILSYASEQEQDGSLRVRYELEFRDIEKFAESVWGWPLQLKVEQTAEDVRLQFDDPARVVSHLFLSAQVGPATAPPKVGEPGGLEYRAFHELVGLANRGLPTRTLVNLPAAARNAENGVLSSANKTVARDAVIGQGEAGLAEWLQAKPTRVLFPAGGVAFSPFAASQALIPEQSLVILGPIEAGEAEGFHVQLARVEIRENRDLSYETANPERRVRRRLSLQMALLGPGDTRLMNADSGALAKPPAHMLSVLKDGDGNDLRSVNTNVSLNVPRYEDGRGQPPQPNRPL